MLTSGALQVDRHIRRLDSDLAKYEDSLVIGLRDGTLPSHDAPSLSLKSPPGPTTSLGAIALGERDAFDQLEEPRKRRRGGGGGMEEQEMRRIKEEKRRQRKEQEERSTRETQMVVNPNEPTFCYCGRASFGEVSLLRTGSDELRLIWLVCCRWLGAITRIARENGCVASFLSLVQAVTDPFFPPVPLRVPWYTSSA